MSCKFSIFQSKRNNIIVNSTLIPKSAYFRTNRKYCHISLYLSFHHLNQPNLPKWTFTYSTVEIGHRTLNPPASNRKSVLIPIVQKGKSTLSITHKYRQSAAYRLFTCTFQDSNALCGSLFPLCLRAMHSPVADNYRMSHS